MMKTVSSLGSISTEVTTTEQLQPADCDHIWMPPSDNFHIDQRPPKVWRGTSNHSWLDNTSIIHSCNTSMLSIIREQLWVLSGRGRIGRATKRYMHFGMRTFPMWWKIMAARSGSWLAVVQGYWRRLLWSPAVSMQETLRKVMDA